MRKFEKISFSEFQKDVKDDLSLYESYNLPKRKTMKSAGYDFESLFDFILKPGEIKKIPLGIKVQMDDGDVFLLYVRSSMGFKYNIRLTNQVGIVDQDFYNNIENEGHMYISLQNEGENDWIVHKKDSICQGIFMKYYTVEDEEEISSIRKGGLGSTSKGENENE